MGNLKRALLIAPLAVLLAAAIFEAVHGWSLAGDTRLPWRAYIPMALGIVLTLLLAAALIGLMIVSQRRGYDEDAHDEASRITRDRDEDSRL